VGPQAFLESGLGQVADLGSLLAHIRFRRLSPRKVRFRVSSLSRESPTPILPELGDIWMRLHEVLADQAHLLGIAFVRRHMRRQRCHRRAPTDTPFQVIKDYVAAGSQKLLSE